MPKALEQLLSDIYPTGNLSLILALAWVITHDYAVYTTWTVTINTYAIDSRKSFYQKDLIDAILKRTERSNIKYMLEDSSKSRAAGFYGQTETLSYDALILSIYASKNIAIWFVDSLEAFGLLEADLNNPWKFYNRDGFFCLVYTGNEPDRLETVKTIFRRLLNIYVVNINVFLMYDNVPYLYTYYPFSKLKCHQSQPEFYLSFRGIREGVKFRPRKRLFPNKLQNMHGCILRLTTWQYPPCVYLERDNTTGEFTRFHGVEGKMLTLIAEQMNFKLKITVPKPGDIEFGRPNGSVSDALQGLITGTSNISMVCLKYDKHRGEVAQALVSYLSQFVVLAIPKGKTMSPFDRLRKPFKYIIWSCLSSSIFFGILLIYTIKCMRRTYLSNFIFGQQNDSPATNLCLILFGGGIFRNPPKRNFSRYLLAVWLLYTMVLRTAYTGELYIILQDARARTTLQSLRELVQHNYTIYSPPVFVDTLREALKSANVHAMDTNEATLMRHITGLQKENARHAVLTFAATVRTYNKANLNRDRYIRALPETVITMPVTIYIKKHSFLKHSFNLLLINMMSSGLIRKFESFYMDASMDRVGSQQAPSKLSLWLLAGLFSIYFALLALCLLVFILEMFAKKSRVLGKCIEFLNY